MIFFMNYAIILILIGVAADNLFLANLSANNHVSIPPWHWIMIIVSMLGGQLAAVATGTYLGKMIFPHTDRYSQVLAVCMLTSLTVKVGKEMLEMSHQKRYFISYKFENILFLVLGASIFQFVMGVAVTWLGINILPYIVFSGPVIYQFIMLGFFMGKSHLIRYVSQFRCFFAVLMLTGIGMLIFAIF